MLYPTARKNISKINERPTLADREPHPEHLPAVNCAHCRDVFWTADYTVLRILGGDCARCNFTRVNSGYGIMEIVIKEPNIYNITKKYFGNEGRLESITDVKFLDDRTLIIGNRLAAIMYYVEFDLDTKTFTVLDRLSLTYTRPGLQLKNGRFQKSSFPDLIDLMTIKGKSIFYVSLQTTIGRVDIVNKKLVKRDLVVVPGDNAFHSITFHPVQTHMMYLSSAMHERTRKLVVRNSLTSEKTDIILPGLEGCLVKDTKFLSDGRIVISGSNGMISCYDNNKVYDGFIGLYAPNFNCLDLIKIPDIQNDGVCVYDDLIYLTVQGVSGDGTVMKYKVVDNKLQPDGKLDIGGFPHGIDARNGLLAVTSMTRSSIHLIPI